MPKSPARVKIPKYIDVIPEGLATAEQLRADGLKPGTIRPVALLEYHQPGRSGVCGLFDRAPAQPLEQSGEGD